MGGCFGSSIYYRGFPWRTSLAFLGLGFPICVTVCLFHGVPEGKQDNFLSVWVTGPTQWVTAITDPRWEWGVCVGSGLFHRKAHERLSWAVCWTQSLSLPRAARLSHSVPRCRPRAAGQCPSVQSLHCRIFSKCKFLIVLVAL